jgi:hypothetical protein
LAYSWFFLRSDPKDRKWAGKASSKQFELKEEDTEASRSDAEKSRAPAKAYLWLIQKSLPEILSPRSTVQKYVALKKALVVTDFSAEASAAIDDAVKLAKLAEMQVAILHIVEVPT